MGGWDFAGGVVGGLIGGGSSAIGQAMQYKFARQEAKRNRRFQRRMSNTAHRREVRDLIAAGLNPILSAGGGSGASTPSGAVASVPDFSRTGEAAMQGASTAMALKTAKQGLENMREQKALTTQQWAKTLNETSLTAERYRTQAETTAFERYRAELEKLKLPEARARAWAYSSWAGKALGTAKAVKEAVPTVGFGLGRLMTGRKVKELGKLENAGIKLTPAEVQRIARGRRILERRARGDVLGGLR